MKSLKGALSRIWHPHRRVVDSTTAQSSSGIDSDRRHGFPVGHKKEEYDDYDDDDESEEEQEEDYDGANSSSGRHSTDSNPKNVNRSMPSSFRSYSSSVEYHNYSSPCESRRSFNSKTNYVSADDGCVYYQQERPIHSTLPSPFTNPDLWGMQGSPFSGGVFPGLLPSSFPNTPPGMVTPTFSNGSPGLVPFSFPNTPDTLGVSSPSLYNFHCSFPQGQNSYVCLGSMRGHAGSSILSLAISGKLLYSASQGKKGILVSRKPRFGEDSWFGAKHGGGVVRAMMVVEDKVYTTHLDNCIRVWQRYRVEGKGHVVKHKVLARLPTVADYFANAITPKSYVEVRRDHKRLWMEHTDVVSCLAMGHDGLLYSGSWDRSVKVWKLSTMRCVESMRAHDDAVNAMIVGNDGFLYTASADSKVKVWVRAGRKRLHKHVITLEGHQSAVNALAFGGDVGRLLYSGSSDSTIRVWERSIHASDPFLVPVATMGGHRQAVLCLAVVTGDAGSLLFSGSADTTVRVWRRHSGVVHSCLAVLEGHSGPVKSIALQSQEDGFNILMFSGGMDGVVRVWRVGHLPIAEEEEEEGTAIRMSPNRTPSTSPGPHQQQLHSNSFHRPHACCHRGTVQLHPIATKIKINHIHTHMHAYIHTLVSANYCS